MYETFVVVFFRETVHQGLLRIVQVWKIIMSKLQKKKADTSIMVLKKVSIMVHVTVQ